MEAFGKKIPEGEQSEVMVIYFAHGRAKENEQNEWETRLHDSWLQTISMTETKFRNFFVDAFPADKFPSVLLLVNSCYSGMLVD